MKTFITRVNTNQNAKIDPPRPATPGPSPRHRLRRRSVVGHARTEAGRLRFGCSLHTMFPKLPGIRSGFLTSCPAFGAWQPPTYHGFPGFSTPNFENAKKILFRRFRLPFKAVVALGLGVMALFGLVACGTDRDPLEDALVLVVSSDLAVGKERVLVSAIDEENRSLVADQTIGLTFTPPGGEPLDEVPGRFIWAIPEVRGMWVAEVPFHVSGRWSFSVRTEDETVVEGAPFAVSPVPQTVGVGDPAPRSETKTGPETPLESLTTDSDPDPRFYEMTVDQAVGSGRPSVIVFATPALCTTQTCGPVLDSAKLLIDRYAEVNWVHVEVYDNLQASDPNDLRVVEAVNEWGLPNEPWVFVVDGAGLVTHRFEGVLDRAELQTALEEVLG